MVMGWLMSGSSSTATAVAPAGPATVTSLVLSTAAPAPAPAVADDAAATTKKRPANYQQYQAAKKQRQAELRRQQAAAEGRTVRVYTRRAQTAEINAHTSAESTRVISELKDHIDERISVDATSASECRAQLEIWKGRTKEAVKKEAADKKAAAEAKKAAAEAKRAAKPKAEPKASAAKKKPAPKRLSKRCGACRTCENPKLRKPCLNPVKTYFEQIDGTQQSPTEPLDLDAEVAAPQAESRDSCPSSPSLVPTELGDD